MARRDRSGGTRPRRRPLPPERSLSRDDVLRVLARRARPALTPKALAREIGVAPGEQRALGALLRELAREGVLDRLGGRYRLRRADGLVESTPAGRRRTARADDGTRWQITGGAPASAGDRVLLEPVRAPGRVPRAEVIRTLEGDRTEYVGIFGALDVGGIVTPYRDDIEWAIPIHPSDVGTARDGDVVVVRPSRRRGRGGGRGGRVVEVLGPPGSPEADFRAIVWRRRIPTEFPPDAIAEAEALPVQLDRGELARRVDLRDRPFVTIDPATARDHDDAVCVERLERGALRLWVAIADVSAYVGEGSALDAEALRRGNSVYFPDRAIPMLPERLSSDLCSLREGVDRLAMVAELDFDRRGEVQRKRFYEAVIRSRRRLVYEEAARVMGRQRSRAGLDPWLVDLLRDLGALARVLQRRRFAAGSIDFDLPSAEIVLGDEGHPVDIVEAPRTAAHRAIEEAMLAANRAVAEHLDEAGIPAVYRVHEAPRPADMEALRDVLDAFGLLAARTAEQLSPRDIARAIQRVSGRPEERLVNLVALRSMQQARYEAENRGHFALAFPSYTHFTSPIRRYADLVVHRALKDWLAGDARSRRRAEARAARLPGAAARISWCERVAMEAEREAVDLKKCAFMASRVGEEYDGTLTGVARHGFYVTLDPFFVEGLVHVSTLDGYFTLDEKSYALVARQGGERFRLGDRVRVVVDQVDQVKGWINFSLLARSEGGDAEAPRRQVSGTRRGRAERPSRAGRRERSRRRARAGRG